MTKTNKWEKELERMSNFFKWNEIEHENVKTFIRQKMQDAYWEGVQVMQEEYKRALKNPSHFGVNVSSDGYFDGNVALALRGQFEWLDKIIKEVESEEVNPSC